MTQDAVTDQDALEVSPVVVLSQTFPARPSSIPDIRDFVQRCLVDAPLNPEDNREIQKVVAQALLDAASPTGRIHVSFRIFPEHLEVDVLRSPPAQASLSALASLLDPAPSHQAHQAPPEEESFASWMGALLKREGLSREAAARELGVSVKTVSRWVGGETEPRLRDLRRIKEVFGEFPVG
ncbi:MAG: helix-turn-helix domain-containing protein [Actinomycetota bacterium]